MTEEIPTFCTPTPAQERIYLQEGTVEPVERDPIAHSPEAIKILASRGVDAYHAHVRTTRIEHEARKRDQRVTD